MTAPRFGPNDAADRADEAAAAPAVSPGSSGATRPRAWRWTLLGWLLPLLLLGLLHIISQRPAPVQDDGVIHWRGGVPASPPPAGMDGGVHANAHAHAHAAGGTWLRLPFDLAAQPPGVWTLQITHRSPLLVYLNGRLLAQSVEPALLDQPVSELKLGSQVLQVNVPPDWLAAGAHELQLRLGALPAHPAAGIQARLGPAAAIAALDRGRGYLAALRTVTALAGLVVGLFLLLVWLAQRDAPVYALAGAQLLLLALLLSPYLLPGQPLPLPWWRVLLDVADVLSKCLMLATVALLAPTPSRRVLRLAGGMAAAGVLIDGLAAWQGLAWSDFSHPWPWWALGSRLLVLATAVGLALYSVWQQPQLERLGTAVAAGLSWAAWAYVSGLSLVWPQQSAVVDLTVVAYAGWVLWMGSLLHRHFAQSARRERQLRAEAALALAERSRELQASFAALQASEHQRLATAERERLLQEMHDGLGSQLMTAKMSAQSGLVSGAEMASALDACIQEMRLTVDTLSVSDGDLGLLLASVRHRVEPGLRAAGLTLAWQVADAPCVPALEGSGGRELVRVVQEALSNVLHHAAATRVTVRTELVKSGRSGRIVIAVIDNGVGLAASRPVDADAPFTSQALAGRGTRNMHQRAKRLGATLSIISPVQGSALTLGGPGTEVRIELPMATKVSGPPRG